MWILLSVLWLVWNVSMLALDGLWARPDLWLLAFAPVWLVFGLRLAARYILHGRMNRVMYYRPGGNSRVGWGR